MEKEPDVVRSHLVLLVIIRFSAMIIVLGLLLFLSAGTFRYWNAWWFLTALILPMIAALVFLMSRSPDLLEKRMKLRETQKAQKLYIVLSLLFFVLEFTLPGLDFRFHWTRVPFWLVIVSTVVMLAGYLMMIVVMKQNRYASRVVEIQENQKVIDTGLYSLVRHPMYLAATVFYGVTPLVLGSWVAIVPMLIFLPLLLVYRIRNEEALLKEGLAGYREYCEKVKYRLIPYIW